MKAPTQIYAGSEITNFIENNQFYLIKMNNSLNQSITNTLIRILCYV